MPKKRLDFWLILTLAIGAVLVLVAWDYRYGLELELPRFGG